MKGGVELIEELRVDRDFARIRAEVAEARAAKLAAALRESVSSCWGSEVLRSGHCSSCGTRSCAEHRELLFDGAALALERWEVKP